MGTNIELNRYLKERLAKSREILDLFKAWDGEIDSMEDLVEESGALIDLIKIQRAYEGNVTALTTSKNILKKTLEISKD